MLLKLLVVFSCFISLSVNFQLTGLLLDLKPRGNRIVNIIITLISVAPSFWLVDNVNVIPAVVSIVSAAVFYLWRLCVYFIIYRKEYPKLLYIYLLTLSIPQIYMNIFEVYSDNYYLANILSFFTDALIMGFLIVYIKKKGNAKFITGLISSLPIQVYVMILILIYIASIFVMAESKENHEIYVKVLLLPSMIGLIAATITIIKIAVSESEKRSAVDLLSKQIESQIEYYEKNNKIYDEFRSFRHDYKNHVLCIRSLIAANKIDEALEYMDAIRDMSSVDKNKYHTGNVIIDALLNDKSEKAEKVNTRLEFDGKAPSAGISNADLCIIMANAIDNAIEACAKDESDKEKIIRLRSDVKRGYFLFRIENPLFEEVRLKGRNKLVTSKKDKEHHGMGVANIVRTAEKYEGDTKISAENDTFVLEVDLHLKEA